MTKPLTKRESAYQYFRHSDHQVQSGGHISGKYYKRLMAKQRRRHREKEISEILAALLQNYDGFRGSR